MCSIIRIRVYTRIRNIVRGNPRISLCWKCEFINILLNRVRICEFYNISLVPLSIPPYYIPCKIDILKRYCISFSELSIYNLSPEDIFSATLWGGLQRNLRIMGTLTALYLQFNRSFRMNDLPQIALNTAIISKELNQLSLANFLNDNVSQALEDKLTYLWKPWF